MIRKRIAERYTESCRAVARALALSMLIGPFGWLHGCSGLASMPETRDQPIVIESIRVTAAGHYLDLRYRVTDPVGANAALGPEVNPLLIDVATGHAMQVPMTAKLGKLRQTQGDQRPDRIYFVLFANTAGVKPGSEVTAEFGDMRFESLIIE